MIIERERERERAWVHFKQRKCWLLDWEKWTRHTSSKAICCSWSLRFDSLNLTSSEEILKLLLILSLDAYAWPEG